MFRILLGVVLISDLLVFRLPNISAFYSADGILDGSIADTFVERLTLLHFIGGESWVRMFFLVSLLFYALFTLGYRSNLFAALSFVSLWSIQQRSSLIISSDDRAILCLLFWCIFLPIGEGFALRPTRHAGSIKEVRNLAAFGLLLQIALIYFFNAYNKDGVTWKNGTAIAYALMDDAWVKPTAFWLLSYPKLCTFLTYTVRPIEFAIPLLIFWPRPSHVTRTAAVALILMLHWSIFVFISLGFYPLIATAWAAVLVPTRVWERIEARVSRLKDKPKFTSPVLGVKRHPALQTTMTSSWQLVLGIVVSKNILTVYQTRSNVGPEAEQAVFGAKTLERRHGLMERHTRPPIGGGAHRCSRAGSNQSVWATWGSLCARSTH